MHKVPKEAILWPPHVSMPEEIETEARKAPLTGTDWNAVVEAIDALRATVTELAESLPAVPSASSRE